MTLQAHLREQKTRSHYEEQSIGRFSR